MEREGERLALEVETGKSDAVGNVRRDLLSEYERVLVVATNESAWRVVWRALEKIGLLVPQLSVVVAGDGFEREARG